MAFIVNETNESFAQIKRNKVRVEKNTQDESHGITEFVDILASHMKNDVPLAPNIQSEDLIWKNIR